MWRNRFTMRYSKTCLKGPLKKNTQNWFSIENYRLMQVKSIAECSKGSILQYFWPSLSYHFPLRPLFCLFLSGRLRQVLLYMKEITVFVQSKEYSTEPDHLRNSSRNACKLWDFFGRCSQGPKFGSFRPHSQWNLGDFFSILKKIPIFQIKKLEMCPWDTDAPAIAKFA